MNEISIWSPRFHDMKVLISKYRVRDGTNRIVFSKTWRDKVLLMDGLKIKSYPIESNGSIPCYAVPVDDFEKEALETARGQLSLIGDDDGRKT